MRQDFTSLHNLLSLNGKTAIVTGSSSGIGLAICRRLCEAGAFVYIADIDEAGGQQALYELQDKGYAAGYIHCDVSEEKDVSDMAESIMQTRSNIDILVNNAGIFPRQALSELSLDLLNKIMATNLNGTLLCCREVSKYMITAGRGGCIINLASIDALHPTATGLVAYDASKGAIVSLTRSLALELGQHDIRVNTIAPGGILTENLQSQIAAVSPAQGKQQLKNFMQRMPLGRMGRADDVARVALFLASELSSYITGSLIVVDGGYLIS
jgi:2-deoxy-D-gluconate 3-dehydrogenase